MSLIEWKLFLALVCLSKGVSSEVPLCNHVTVCPNTLAEFLCTVNDSIILTWTVPDINSNNIQLQNAVTIDRNVTNGIYNALVTEGNVTLRFITSKLTFIAPLELSNSNTEIICTRGSGGDEISCPFTVEGEPSSPPNVVAMAIEYDTVNMSWSSPYSGSYCIDYYTVMIDNGTTTQNITTDSTSIIINELEQGLIYSYGVKAVDVGGREGTISETVILTMEVPQVITTFQYSVSINDIISVFVSWEAPQDSLRPPITRYNVYYNVSSSYESLSTNTNNVTIVTSTTDPLTVIVNAENIIGNGDNASITVYIPSLPTDSQITSSIIASNVLLPSIGIKNIIVDKILSAFVFIITVYHSLHTTEPEIQSSSYIQSSTGTPSFSCIISSVIPTQSISNLADLQTAIAVSTIATAVLVSVVSVLITSLVFCLLMKRNRSTSTTTKGSNRVETEESKDKIIYDLPSIQDGGIIGDKVLQQNAAYGVLQQ